MTTTPLSFPVRQSHPLILRKSGKAGCPSRLFVHATISWIPHPLRRSWLLVFQLRSKGWVRSPFDSHRPIVSQSFRHDAEILATHPSLRSKKQKRSSAKDGAPTATTQVPVLSPCLQD